MEAKEPTSLSLEQQKVRMRDERKGLVSLPSYLWDISLPRNGEVLNRSWVYGWGLTEWSWFEYNWGSYFDFNSVTVQWNRDQCIKPNCIRSNQLFSNLIMHPPWHPLCALAGLKEQRISTSNFEWKKGQSIASLSTQANESASACLCEWLYVCMYACMYACM